MTDKTPKAEGRPDRTTQPLGAYSIADQLALVRDRAVALAIHKLAKRVSVVVYTDLRSDIPVSCDGGMTKREITDSLARLIGRRLIRRVKHRNRAGTQVDALKAVDARALAEFVDGFSFEPDALNYCHEVPA